MSRTKLSDQENLLVETIEALQASGKSIKDVRWVGDDNANYGWDKFASKATKINYDSSYGTNEINLHLVVVGDDWWLERHEYDGSEWWEFKTLPSPPGIGKVSIKEE